MTRRTAKELWDALGEATLDAAMESVIAMTPDEREAEQVKAGVDLDEVHAEADAFFEKLPAAQAASSSQELDPRRRP
jgi:ATP-dependent RNA circularization protein (DNA/RNA ligase family)